jgi:hypothetical protein
MHEHGEPQYALDKDNSEQTYPRGQRLAAVASALARGGPAAALSPRLPSMQRCLAPPRGMLCTPSCSSSPSPPPSRAPS